jgi:hypothetical protein
MDSLKEMYIHKDYETKSNVIGIGWIKCSEVWEKEEDTLSIFWPQWQCLEKSTQVSLSVLAAITKYHELGGLNREHLLLTVVEIRKPKIKVLTNLIPCDISGGLNMILNSLFCVFTWLTDRQSELMSFLLFIRALILPWWLYSHDLRFTDVNTSENLKGKLKHTKYENKEFTPSKMSWPIKEKYKFWLLKISTPQMASGMSGFID